jgi:hypothetical protein
MDRLTRAIADSRHASYITHPLFKLAVGRAPLAADNPLASGSTHSRLEGSLRRSDIYRLARALVEQFVAGYRCAPATITLDLDHMDDAAYS